MSGYRLTPAAANDLVAILQAGHELFGLGQADVYHHGLEQAFDFLASYPQAARERMEIRPPVRAYPHKAHLILYEIDDAGGVVILRVRHGRENWSENPL